MGLPFRLTVIFLTAAGMTMVCAGGPPAAEPAGIFAPDALCGQVLALTVDDAGRVQAAVTVRSFGRGTLDLDLVPDLRAEDRRLLSVEGRIRQARAWLAGGRLDPLLKERRKFFPQTGEGPPDFLTKYGESIKWLTDVNGDGRAEAAETVADGFRSAGDGPGSALLALPGGGWLYGCAPDLWLLSDAGGDGKAGERKVVAGGFGLRNDPQNHSLHALLEAPDGWIYFATGDQGYFVREADGTRRRGLGSGAIFRCRADGSALEKVAGGLRNPTGLAMDEAGRLFAMDAAVPGGKARLLLVIPGADFGWQAEAVTAPGEGLWFRESMGSSIDARSPSPDRPQWFLPAVESWEGTASTLEMRADGTLLAADARGGGRGGIRTLKLIPQGAGFRVEADTDVWRGRRGDGHGPGAGRVPLPGQLGGRGGRFQPM